MKEHFGKYLGPTLIDESQPLTAWRTWRLAKLNSSERPIRLTGTWASQFTWQPKGATVAECLTREKGKGCNVSMRPGCNCGLWAAVALTNLLTHGAVGLYPTGVLGRVHLWGFVHVYRFGFRASMGRPVECWLGNSAGDDVGRQLAAEYGIPVYSGLPVECVIDPDLIAPGRVIAAAGAYMSTQGTIAATAQPLMPEVVETPKYGGPRCLDCQNPVRVGPRCYRCGQRARRDGRTTATAVKV